MATPRTLFEKIWDAHIVRPQTAETPAVLYIDLQLIHEVTSPQAFTEMRQRGLTVRRPDKTLATMDHSTPTTPRGPDGIIPVTDPQAIAQLSQLEKNCAEFGIPLFKLGDDRQGIVHVIGPEQGLTQPGMTIVCGDSHTSTHGAFGALAFGIGTSEVAHVLATQCLIQSKPKTMEVRIDGRLQRGVTAKDIILAIIAQNGVGGGTGYVFEYTGEAIRALSMEERMTICNMSIEGGARAGLIAPDETTFAYVAGRPFAPKGAAWDAAVAAWRALPTDEGATYDATITLDANALTPMITYGTNPGMGMPIDGRIPTPSDMADPSQRTALDKALRYMDLRAGRAAAGPQDRYGLHRQLHQLAHLRSAAGGRHDQGPPGRRRCARDGRTRQRSRSSSRPRPRGCTRSSRPPARNGARLAAAACLAMNDDKVPPASMRSQL